MCNIFEGTKSALNLFGSFCLIIFLFNTSTAYSLQNTIDLSAPHGFTNIEGNDQLANALCFGKNPKNIDEIFFKGPKCIGIRAKINRNAFPGLVFEFELMDLGKSAKLATFITSGFSYRNMPMPLIFDINEKYIIDSIDMNDGGKSYQKYRTRIFNEFLKLPIEFQDGLKEFFLFTDNAAPGISIFSGASGLGYIFRDQLGLVPYSVICKINKNKIDINNFINEIKSILVNFPAKNKNVNFNKPSAYGKLLNIKTNNKYAKTMCVGRDDSGVNDILFQGPSGTRVRLIINRSKLSGYSIKYMFFLNEKTYTISRYYGILFKENSLSTPIAYSINGNFVGGIFEESPDRRFEQEIAKEITNLPREVQNGMREFHQYAISTLIKMKLLENDYRLIGNELKIEPINSVVTIGEKTESEEEFHKGFIDALHICPKCNHRH